ncbi:hypothetical protein [Streptomyces griseoruber]|uniref:Uncharacterized protein n=1 Tax=Streptomyces griseoruber TaxID=1943 RepID=A0A101SSF8_9ACTN|nr:hypothetical protein [Streptomyces griseoruber]KUN79359.1 hypothetical protein AQJ64_28795 [Streptomyces griseoruber]
MESAEPPEEEVRPPEPSEEELLDESSEPEESVEPDEPDEPEESVEPDELLELSELSESLLVLELELVPLLADVVASACRVPIRANTPAAPASVTAAAKAAVRRAPLRTAAAAPRSSSLVAMTVPLRSDVLSRTTVGERPERSL